MNLKINTQKEPSKVTQLFDAYKQYLEFISNTGAVSHHYESRRREYLDAQPYRESAKETNIKNTKVQSRKRQVCQP